jgi:hypothetical protein
MVIAALNPCTARRSAIVGACILALGLTAAPASAQQIDPEADKILHSMADYVAGLKAFTVSYDTCGPWPTGDAG